MRQQRRFGIGGILPALVIGGLANLVSAQTDEGPRQWNSRDGKHSITAAFSGYDKKAKTVTLRYDNGQTVDIKLRDLSRADQRFVKRMNSPKKQDGLSAEFVFDEEPATKSKKRKRKTSRSGQRNDFLRRYGINWTPGMESAIASAKGSDSASDERPIMWFRVLGDLNGYM